MKRFFLITILLGIGLMYAYSQDSIVSIPDTAFLYALIERGVDTNGDSLISYGEAEVVNALNVDQRSITDLTGIGAFKNLEKLSCFWNRLRSLDLSSNTFLRVLICRENYLTSLDISKNTALIELDCAVNNLITLDVSKNTKLEKLICFQNNLSSLDVSNNIAIQHLNINFMPTLFEVCVWESFPSGVKIVSRSNVYFTTECVYVDNVFIPDTVFLNALIEVGVDTNADSLISYAEAEAITFLNLNGNINSTRYISNMTGIHAFINLDTLFCDYNQMYKLDVSLNTSLTYLGCAYNRIGRLDLSGCSGLTRLDCNGNQLNSLDISRNPALERLDCRGNKLAYLKVLNNPALSELDCAMNEMFGLNISGCNELRRLDCGNNNLLHLDISRNPALESLRCLDNRMTDLDASNNTALTKLECDRNKISSLDISRCTGLKGLVCSRNQLTKLDVSRNPALEWLLCHGNQLTSLDVSKNTALVDLKCSSNELTSLDVSNNSLLSILNCGSNQITRLNLCGYRPGFLLNIADMPSLDSVFLWSVDYVDSIGIHKPGSPNVVFVDCSTIDDDLDSFNFYADCNDLDSLINPGAMEIPNNDIDEDCDGIALIVDEDGDSFNSDLDCNDQDSLIYPGAVEIPNNEVDEDCDGVALVIDEDGDGFNSDVDCNDQDSKVFPGATEIPDNDIDEDCDGVDMSTVNIENDELGTYKIFPNPIDDLLYIETSDPGSFHIQINSMNGLTIFDQEVSESLYKVDLSSFQKGVYFITIRSKDFVTTRKIIKL